VGRIHDFRSKKTTSSHQTQAQSVEFHAAGVADLLAMNAAALRLALEQKHRVGRVALRALVEDLEEAARDVEWLEVVVAYRSTRRAAA
jgi:hypothetical protein